ncbi:hypothetical protein KSF_046380 [Reticulibacter mediterranei]|uniref:ABC-three component systems C-terminal domain-containing protein n=1 Tax=Reticulibacter mediterranei TaxID=2778369 RepID=A0A8J3IPL8_9CHLR|nr:ABC-three component system protein [Reticulibacter mediterranei]GHO94590.1 hypothetical protein KSF_046380 [Reticulibacter mediterranei]
MDTVKYSYYEMKFKLAYLEKRGNEFQDFFSELMEKCHPGNFQRVRPWGKIGDRKNDGYLRSERVIFQVYAPNEMEAIEAIAKIRKDFQGALRYWHAYLDKWVFVHNARDGLGPDVLGILLELQASHPSVSICSWGFEELRQKAFSLNEADLASLLGGYAPSSKDMLDVQYNNVQEVLHNIARQKLPLFQDIRQVPPGKLKFNRLSENVQILLTSGMWKADLVGNFFNDHPHPQYGDEIALAFNNQYKKYKMLNMEPDIIFSKLQEFAGGVEMGNPAHQAAALAVLAYLFEQCEIFERSPEEVTP